MQKAINRFWDYLFHPGIRWYHFPKGKAAWFRYPSPGSQINQQAVQDYKTPYQHSELNIRYKRPVHSIIDQKPAVYKGDGFGVTAMSKLKQAGLISNNPSEQQLQQAKQKYFQKFGIPVEQRFTRNDLDLDLPQGNNRQAIRQFIQKSYKELAHNQRKVFDMVNTNRRFIQQPEPVDIESLDMFTMPHMQQTRIEVKDRLDNLAKNNAERGYIDIKRGQKSFWKALDSTNDSKNIENVQKAIGDENPTDFKIQNTRIEFQKNQKGDVVDVHPRTKSL